MLLLAARYILKEKGTIVEEEATCVPLASKELAAEICVYPYILPATPLACAYTVRMPEGFAVKDINPVTLARILSVAL